MPDRTKTIGQESYENFAAHYAARRDTKAHNAYYEQPAMLSLLPPVAGLRILDAGCGPGVYTEWLVQQGAASVVAVDVTPQMLEIAQKRMGESGRGRVEFYQADLGLPLTFAHEAEFDLILCPLVLDYIEDWSAVFREFRRVLKSGGVFVYSAGHPQADFRYSPNGNYFQTELFEMLWNWQGQGPFLIKSYRRPLQAMLNPMLEAGLRLDRILEPLPTAEFQQQDPEDYEKLLREPGFILVRGRKNAEE